MCGGIREMQNRRTPRLHEGLKHDIPRAAGKPMIISCCTPRRHQPAPAGLAIVAALEAELVQSGGATSGTKPAASAPSFTSSLPIPISSLSSSAYEEINKANEINDDRNLDHSSAYNRNKKGDYITNDHNVKRHNGGAQEKSIFSTSLSPPCSTYNYVMGEGYDDFLGVCFSCKRPLRPGKDIYMYRGDRGFCSTECRHKHIVADETLLCSIQINQQCVQASSPTNKPKYTPPVAIAILV